MTYIGYVSLNEKMEYEQTPTVHGTANFSYITITLHVHTVGSVNLHGTYYVIHFLSWCVLNLIITGN
jgi:hypothetical protein